MRSQPLIVILLAVGLMVGPTLPAEAAHLAPPVRSSILAAVDHLLNQDPDAAEVECRRLKGLDISGLLAPFCLAYVQLTRAAEKEDPDEDVELFLIQTADIIEEMEEALEEAPKDADLLFLLGMTWGYKAMADGVLKRYLAAYKGIKRAYHLLQETLKVNPSYYDAYYGLGLYHYGFSRLPAFYRTIASLILPRGDRELGLHQLHLAAEKGTYTKMLAKFSLLRIYGTPEEDYRKALPFARELLARYPGNPELYFHLAFLASELGRWEEAFEIARRIEENIQEERNHFSKVMTPRYLQLMGKLYMDKGDYPQAIAYFQEAIAHENKRYAWAVAWAWTRMGMIYDLLGDRKAARRHYKMALKVDSDGLAKEYAKRYLADPYTGRERRG